MLASGRGGSAARIRLDRLRVLVVHDALEPPRFAAALAEHGFAVTQMRMAATALRALPVLPPGLLLLDGLRTPVTAALLGAVRRDTLVHLGVVVAGRPGASAAAAVEAFTAGADEYVTHDVDPRELVARIRAVARRCRPTRALAAQYHGPRGFLLNAAARSALVRGTPVPLTSHEFLLLHELVRRRGQVVPAGALSARLDTLRPARSLNRVEAIISRLRAKLASYGAGDVIRTVRGTGYLVPLQDAPCPGPPARLV